VPSASEAVALRAREEPSSNAGVAIELSTTAEGGRLVAVMLTWILSLPPLPSLTRTMQASDFWNPTAALNVTTPWLLTVAVPSSGWELMVQVNESLSASVAASVAEPVPLELQVSVAGLAVVMAGA